MTIEVPQHQKVHVTYDGFVLVLHLNVGNMFTKTKDYFKKKHK
jgi:hypothetical protein